MFGFGGGQGNTDSNDREGAAHFGGSGLGTPSSGKGGRVGTGTPGGQNGVGDRDRQGPGNVGTDTGKGDRVGNRGSTSGTVGDVGGFARDIRTGGSGAKSDRLGGDAALANRMADNRSFVPGEGRGFSVRDFVSPERTRETIVGRDVTPRGPLADRWGEDGFDGLTRTTDKSARTAVSIDPARWGDNLTTEKTDRLGYVSSFGGRPEVPGSLPGAPGATVRDAELAQSARRAENLSMDSYDRARQTALGELHRSAEDAVTTGTDFGGVLSKMRKAEGADYNTLSGGKKADIESMTVRDAVKFAGMPWSGKLGNILGGYQFKDKTLAGIAKEMGLLDEKMTPAVQDKLAQGLAQKRANNATLNGKIDIDAFAKQLAQEWAAFATPSGLSHYASNGIDKASLSWPETKALAKEMVDTGFVTPGGSVSKLSTGQVTTQRQQSFIDRFLTAPQTQPMDRAANPHEVPSIDATGGATGAPAATRDASVFGNQPEGPTDGTEYPDRPRTTGEKLVAGGIDVLAGVINPTLGLANAGFGALTGRSIGDRIVDFLAEQGGNPGDFKFNDQTGDQGALMSRRVAERKAATTAKLKAEQPKAKTFADTFLSTKPFVDNTVRPTPAVKWDGKIDSEYV